MCNWSQAKQSSEGEQLSLVFSQTSAIALRECTILPLLKLSPIPACHRQERNWQPPSLTQPLRGTQSFICDWTDKKIVSVTSYRNIVSYKTSAVWTFFPRYFLFSCLFWFSCVFLHLPAHLSGCKERLMFTGMTVSTLNLPIFTIFKQLKLCGLLIRLKGLYTSPIPRLLNLENIRNGINRKSIFKKHQKHKRGVLYWLFSKLLSGSFILILQILCEWAICYRSQFFRDTEK